MLMLRTLRRRRIWRDFCHNMAAIMGVSIVLCFCGTVFKVTTNPTGRLESDGWESAPAALSHKKHIIHYGKDGGISVSGQRHNRALQFMDSQKFGGDVSDSKEVANTRDSQENSWVTQRDVGGWNQRLGSVDLATSETTVDTRQRKDSSLKESGNGVLQLSSVPPPYQPTRHAITRSWDRSSSRNALRVHGDNDSPLNVVAALVSDRSSHTRQIGNNSEALSKRLPQAIIIGAKKAGTRALLEFLRLHPLVEGTGPEPHFFDRNYNKGLQWYRDHMPESGQHQMTIEKTPGYFVTRDAPRRIFDMNPSIKLILVVRDPVTRAISDYCQAVSKHAMKPFEEMALLDAHLGLVNTSWGAIRIGVYAKHMERWLQVFSLNQIHIVDGQKLIEEPAREVAKVETFLGLPKYINDSHFYLRGFKGTFPCLIREGKPHCLDERSKGRDHPVVKESVLQRLRDFFRPFNAKFYQMVGRNFDWS